MLGSWLAFALALGAAVGTGGAAIAARSAVPSPPGHLSSPGRGQALANSTTTTATTSTTRAPTASTTRAAATTAAPTTVAAPSSTTPAPERRLTPRSTVTPGGIGPVRVGMTIAQAERAGGVRLLRRYTEYAPRCFYVVPKGWPKQRDGDVLIDTLGFMVTDGRIARVDVWSGDTVASAGVGIGSTETAVRQAYPGRVETTSHHYEGPTGHYLTFVPPGDVDERIVFETDGKTVTRYRAGKRPEVEFVEGCA
jgi:hypothetical protein